MSEKPLLNEILIKFNKLGRLFRNNTGQGWAGKFIKRYTAPTVVTVRAGDVLLRNARPINFGLCKGGSDLVGWTRLDGRSIFTAIEVKYGRTAVTKEQKNFIDQVNKTGGIGIVARNWGDIPDEINQYTAPSLQENDIPW